LRLDASDDRFPDDSVNVFRRITEDVQAREFLLAHPGRLDDPVKARPSDLEALCPLRFSNPHVLTLEFLSRSR
jgi:hypothetical protein